MLRRRHNPQLTHARRLKAVKPTDIVSGMDAEPWIDSTRQKTDASTRIQWSPTALDIIEKPWLSGRSKGSK